MSALNRGRSCLTAFAVLAGGVQAQTNQHDMWIEPGCPKAGDQVTLFTEWYDGGRLMVPPVQVSRAGSTVSVVYTSGVQILPIPLAGYPVGIPLGTFEAGTYRVQANFEGVTFPSSAISIDIVVAPSNTPAQNSHSFWHNPATPGYGISIFRGDRTVAGTYYTYRNDRFSRWMLLQRVFCTPTGYAGSFFGYINGNPFESPDSAWTTPPTAINDGRWVFNFTGANTATIFERGNINQPNLANTRSLTRLVLP